MHRIGVIFNMFLSSSLLFRLTVLPITYFFAIIFLWSFLGVHVFWLGVPIIIINTLFFSAPFLNYGVVVAFSLLTIYSINVPILSLLQDFSFWGIQATSLCMAIVSSIFQNRYVPYSAVKGQKKIDKILFKKDKAIVKINCILHTIEDISKDASEIYGWRHKELLHKPLTFIYPVDIIDSPPKGFWEDLENSGAWHGFIDVKEKNGVIYEERAFYTATKNEEGEIVFIEKKIVEVFSKNTWTKSFDCFTLFYEESPLPMAVINKSHIVEQTNAIFLRSLVVKPIFEYSKFADLFLEEQREQIVVSLNRAFDGEKNSFKGIVEELDGGMAAKFIFIPYKDPKYLEITRVLFILNILDKQEVSSVPVVLEEKMDVLALLKLSLTKIYGLDPTHKLKLYGHSLPSILLVKRIWENIFDTIVGAAMHYEGEKALVFSCVPKSGQLFFEISFSHIPYVEYRRLKEEEHFKKIEKIILEESGNVFFMGGKKAEVILCFSVKE